MRVSDDESLDLFGLSLEDSYRKVVPFDVDLELAMMNTVRGVSDCLAGKRLAPVFVIRVRTR